MILSALRAADSTPEQGIFLHWHLPSLSSVPGSGFSHILMIPTLYTLYAVTVVIIPTTCTWLLKRILVHLFEVCAGLFEETSTVHFRQACQYLKMCGMGGGHTLGNSLTSGPVAPFVLSPCSTQSLLSMTGEITRWMTPKVYSNLRVRTLLS